jgi:hypothetical protein
MEPLLCHALICDASPRLALFCLALYRAASSCPALNAPVISRRQGEEKALVTVILESPAHYPQQG